VLPRCYWLSVGVAPAGTPVPVGTAPGGGGVIIRRPTPGSLSSNKSGLHECCPRARARAHDRDADRTIRACVRARCGRVLSWESGHQHMQGRLLLQSSHRFSARRGQPVSVSLSGTALLARMPTAAQLGMVPAHFFVLVAWIRTQRLFL